MYFYSRVSIDYQSEINQTLKTWLKNLGMRRSRSRFLTIPIMVCIDYYPIKILIVSVHWTAITNLLAKLPFIKYPEMSNQVQIIMRKLMRIRDGFRLSE